MIKAYELSGGGILLTGNGESYTSRHEFHQGGCPLKLARELKELAGWIEETARQMGATREGGW